MSIVVGLKSSYLVVFLFLLALFGITHAEEHFDVNKISAIYVSLFICLLHSFLKDSE
jgi:hypothetical protein